MKKVPFIFMGILLISWGFAAPAAAVDAETVIQNYLSIDLARTNAQSVLSDFVSKGPLQENDIWTDAAINESPVTIYDPDGLKLYYLFIVEQKGTPIGEIEVPASKLLGSPVSSIRLKPHTWDFDRAREQVQKFAGEKYPGHTIASIKLVDYAPSRIGVMAELLDPENGSYERLVVDAHTFAPVPENITSDAEGRYGAVCVESLYDSIPDKTADERIEHWTECQETLQKRDRSSSDAGAGDGGSLFGRKRPYYGVPAANRLYACVYALLTTASKSIEQV